MKTATAMSSKSTAPSQFTHKQTGEHMKTATSIRDLARGVGRSSSVVARWVKRPDWNQGPRPPWDVERAIEWSKHLAPNPADAEPDSVAAGASAADALEHLRRNPLSAAKLKLAVVRAQKLEIEKAILVGDLVSRRDVEIALVRRAYAVRAAFEALPRQLAGLLVDLDERQIEQQLAAGIEAALTELSRQIELPEPPLV
jgi:phage terminase Nu1 subunit (DNA packaging protein)